MDSRYRKDPFPLPRFVALASAVRISEKTLERLFVALMRQLAIRGSGAVG